jgi:uncharacterized Tic20 family protein
VTRNESGDGFRRAEDLGRSGFDPHAPYKQVEPDAYFSINEPLDSNDKNLALLAHLSGCLAIVFGAVPGFVGPLVIWLIQRDKSKFVEQESKEALNFQITLLIVWCVAIVLTFLSCWMLFPLIFVPLVMQVVFGIIATVSVANGNAYRYPFNLRLIK